jgi:adenine-specific DNA-methyltransferase
VGAEVGSGPVDAGFRALKLDSSSRSDVLRTPDATTQEALLDLDSVFKADRTPEDLLFDVLLDSGLDLASPIVSEQVEGHEIQVVDGAALIACYAPEIRPDLVRALAHREPRCVVFRDSAFPTDAARINAQQVFEEVSPATDVKVL